MCDINFVIKGSKYLSTSKHHRYSPVNVRSKQDHNLQGQPFVATEMFVSIDTGLLKKKKKHMRI